MKALVTGGTGFLGRHLCLRLKKEGYTVTALGRNVEVGHELEESGILFVKCDLEDSPLLLSLCKEQNAVFHCAALSSPWGKYIDFYKANVLGTQNVVQACLKQGVSRLIHVSSPSIYFNFKNQREIHENAELPRKFANAYAKSKWLAENVIFEAIRDSSLEAIIIRPRGIFGPHDRALIPRLMKVSSNFGVPLINGGRAMVDLTYVANVVEALVLSAKAGASSCGRAYNISNGEPIAIGELLQMLFESIGYSPKFWPVPYTFTYGIASVLELIARLPGVNHEPLLTRYKVAVMSKDQTLDIRAGQDTLGYIPNITLKEGIKRTALWWKNTHAS